MTDVDEPGHHDAPDRDRPPADRDRDRPPADRDRDAAGRPRQARPRDALGRPLPYGVSGVDPVPEDPLPPRETIALARQLLAAGRPFAAHETFEVAWRHRPARERELWQGLAQVCAGLTHAARGNATGADRLLARGAQRLDRYLATGGPTYDVDPRGLLDRARAGALDPFSA